MTRNAPITDAGQAMTSYRCTKPGCTIAQDGLCLEDIDPVSDCKSLVIPEDEVEDDEAPEATAKAVPVRDEVALYHGDALTLDEARRFVGTRATTVVSLVGDQKAGKTTFLATLFEKFSVERFAGCLFAETRTPMAFERRCHDSRTTSGRTEADTARTPLEDDLRFLHLALRIPEEDRRVDLLFADRPGEQFDWLRKSDDYLPYFLELSAADVVMLLVDGDRLTGTATRGNERHQTLLMARVLHQSGALRRGTRVLVVMTKVDLMDDRPTTGPDAFDLLVTRLTELYGGDWLVSSFRIAARSPKGLKRLGHGMAPLLHAIVAPAVAEVLPRAERPDLRGLTPFEVFAFAP